jgi:hypothetical protein
MSVNPPKKTSLAKSQPKTVQQLFDKWFLPFVFVVLGCVIGGTLFKAWRWG